MSLFWYDILIFRRPLPKVQAKQEAPKKKNGDKDDNWDDYEVDLPYCKH